MRFSSPSNPSGFLVAITAEALAYDRQFAWTLWITGIIFVAAQVLLALPSCGAGNAMRLLPRTATAVLN